MRRIACLALAFSVPVASAHHGSLVHSEALEITERFSLDAVTQALKREFVAADARFFREPYTGADIVHPSNVPYEADACDDRSLL